MPSIYPCSHCTKRFSKHDKLQRHLLTAHRGELRLSPERSAESEAVGSALAKAVATANAAFGGVAAGSLCPCVICGDSHKPFRNAMDLAQHLVAKHEPGVAEGLYGESEMGVAIVETKSEVSASGGIVKQNVGKDKVGKGKKVQGDVSKKAKGKIGDGNKGVKRKINGTEAGANKLAKTKVDVSDDRAEKAVKRKADVLEKDVAATDDIITAVKPVSTGKVGDAAKPSAPKKRRLSASGEPGVSGTKPPITPKKKDSLQASWVGPKGSRIPVIAVIAAPMDFSCFGGFAANSHKSYYRRLDR